MARTGREARKEQGRKNNKGGKKIRKNKKKTNIKKKNEKGNKKKTKLNRRKQKGKANKRKNKKNKNDRRKGNKRKNSKKNSRRNKKNKNRKNKGKKNKTIRIKNQKKNVTSSACLASVIDALKKRVIVFNFENQRKRVERQTKLAGLKFGKRTIFAGIAAKLIKAGGGNNQSLSCKGSTTSQEAKNLTSLSQTLLKCDAEITKVCGPSFPKYDMDLVKKCEPKSKEFITLAKDCLKKDVVSDEANTCKCWTDPKFMEIVKGVAPCEIKEKNEIADAIDKCKKTFMLCKKSEDATVNLIYKCQGNINILRG